MTLDEYRALQAKAPRRNASPEHDLQCAVVKALEQLESAGLLHCFDWSASLAGARLTPRERVKMKRAGMRPGWPDLQFACWDGVTRYIELKAGGSLSADQRHFRCWAEPQGIWALCRSTGDVLAALTGWGMIKQREAA